MKAVKATSSVIAMKAVWQISSNYIISLETLRLLLKKYSSRIHL